MDSKKSIFKRAYEQWLVIADKIAYVQTRIILFILYFIGIGTYGIISFIFRVDLLNKKWKRADTYYIPKEEEALNLERYERQF